jgi:hypothetical protein
MYKSMFPLLPENLILNKWTPGVSVPKPITPLWKSSSTMNGNDNSDYGSEILSLSPELSSTERHWPSCSLSFVSFETKNIRYGWNSPWAVIWCPAFLLIRNNLRLRVAFRTKVRLNGTEQKTVLKIITYFKQRQIIGPLKFYQNLIVCYWH